MKRFLLLGLAAMISVITYFGYTGIKDAGTAEDEAAFGPLYAEVYCLNAQNADGFEVIDGGGFYIIRCGVDAVTAAERAAAGVLGVTQVFSGGERDFAEIGKKLCNENVIKQKNLSINIIQGFSRELGETVQIAYRGNKIYIGVPMLIGSY